MFKEIHRKHDNYHDLNIKSKSSKIGLTLDSYFKMEALNDIESRIQKRKIKWKENLSNVIKRIAS